MTTYTLETTIDGKTQSQGLAAVPTSIVMRLYHTEPAVRTLMAEKVVL